MRALGPQSFLPVPNGCSFLCRALKCSKPLENQTLAIKARTREDLRSIGGEDDCSQIPIFGPPWNPNLGLANERLPPMKLNLATHDLQGTL